MAEEEPKKSYDISDDMNRFKMDPFQIFCIQNRKQIAIIHPEMKTWEITSYLSQVWRSKSNTEKQIYVEIAEKLDGNRYSTKKKKKILLKKNH